MEMLEDNVRTAQTISDPSTERGSCCCQCRIQRVPHLPERQQKPHLDSGSKTGRDSTHSEYSVKTGSRTKKNKFSESCRTRTESRSRDKSSDRVEANSTITPPDLKADTRVTLHVTGKSYSERWCCAAFFTSGTGEKNSRVKMVRILCHCVLLLAVVACGAALLVQSSKQNKNMDGNKIIHKPSQGSAEYIHHSADTHILTDQPFQSVSLDEFHKTVENSESPADLFRIFFENKNLTDFQINEVLKMKTYRVDQQGLERDVEFIGDQEEEEEGASIHAAYNHFRSMTENPLYQCRDPRPEVICVEAEIGATIRHYVPQCTIVHRCHKQDGCCRKGYECQAKRIGVVRLPFLVYEETASGEKVRPSEEDFVEMKSFVNHTECVCQPVVKDKIKCPKKCPLHFTLRVSNTGCHCDCRGSETCRLIRRGDYPLEESDLECIKMGNCYVPSCVRGHFKIRNGFCPST